MKKIILLVLVFLNFANAQNPITVPSASTNVFTNQNFHNASGIYNASLNNTNFEFLTNTQMLAITTPKVGREVYNTTDSKRYYYNGTSWVAYTTGIPSLDWVLTGNAGTIQATNFLGTTDNVGLSFRTNNVIRQTITNTGNVGIGITNPTEMLEVGGNIRTQTAANQHAGVSIFAGTGTTAAELNLGRNGARIWHFGLQASNRFSFVESGVAERFSILQGGNVGINTTTQTSTFQVNGSQAGTVTIVTANITLNATHHKILVSNGATNITITLPDALTCLGREYIFSRAAGSTGGITVQRTGTNVVQALNGTTGATTSIGLHSAKGRGLRHSFTAINIGGVGVWVRL